MKALPTIPIEPWALLPDTLAMHISRGKWKPYNYLVLIADKVVEMICNGGGRMIVCLPPRHGKSELISHWIPVWLLERFSTMQIILTTYEATFAAHWGGKVKDDFLNSDELKTKIRSDRCRIDDFQTTDGGSMKTAGVGGPITGRGFDLGIIDDPVKNFKDACSKTVRKTVIDWFNSTFYTRAEPGGSIVLLMTRWHEEDLAGYLVNDHADNWDLMTIPAVAEAHDPIQRPIGEALCPERYPLDALAQKREGVGSRMWEALYQGRPSSEHGEIWQRIWWRFWTDLPTNGFDQIIQSWDLTFKEGKEMDFVVGQVWGKSGPHRYLLDQVRGQWGFTKTIEMIELLSQKWPKAKRKLIEQAANGAAAEDQLKRKLSGIKLIPARGGKVARAMASEPEIESGHVYLPHPGANPWVSDFIEECAAFPKGKNDDQVDTASQALNWFSERSTSSLYNITKR